MPKQDYYKPGQLTDVAYLVLVSLTKPLHGYLIMSEIEKMTEGEVRMGPASLYTTLKKLTAAGFIRLTAEDATKKVYHITEEGLVTLNVEMEKRQRYVQYAKLAIEKMEEKVYE